ncbi:hypothetical protein ACGFNU_25330 [Spirillospora sp. NPDC048911]|uniref:hypothetical protein n=1 Tax=Spirillospora sp. NPDC048911 TaxID=3364527 RepID=UPI00371E54B1
MPNQFEVAQLGIDELPTDLHYQLTDPRTGRRSSLSAGRSLPGESERIPRVTVEVMDLHGETLFFVDRSERVVGHGGTPQCAAIDPSGRVIGYKAHDHYKIFEPMRSGNICVIPTMRSWAISDGRPGDFRSRGPTGRFGAG